MKRRIKITVSILVSLLFSACTIANYQTRNMFNNTGPLVHNEPCDIKYTFVITSGSRTNTYGVRDTKEDQLQELKNRYIESTEKVLKNHPCAIAYVEDGDQANFKVRVERMRDLSALPQEWLTGLSLGLIPSWGIRPNTFVYTFDDTKAGKYHSYYIDERTYNHILLFPIFWVNFLTPNEFDVYEKSLINFVQGTE
jgi:hypothetical protein